MRLIHLEKRKLMLPLILILLMCQTPPWTNQNRIDLESEASQLLHQQKIDFNCKNGFQRGMPFRAVHPPRSSNEKKPNKNRLHSCGRLIHLQKKKTAVAICNYTIDVPDSTMDQPKQNWLGIKSFTSASSKEHRFQLQKWFSKENALHHPPRSSKEKQPQ